MDVFFYGLFMDTEILAKNGINTSNPRRGHLDNYELRIGNRASLIPTPSARAYGIVMTVDDNAITGLYAEASVADYVPEDVDIISDAGESISAVCYNLPLELMTGTNESYAQKLHVLAKKEGFPEEYLDQIKRIAGGLMD